MTSAQALADQLITPAPLGTARAGNDLAGRLEAQFDITGGTIDTATGAALIEHDGSGLSLTDQLGTQVLLENFLIDSVAELLFGDVLVLDDMGGEIANLGNVALFEIDDCSDVALSPDQCLDGSGAILTTGFQLLLTAGAADALSSVLVGADGQMLPNLTGAQIGVARIAVRPIPEPGTALLTGAAFVGLALYRRGRR